MYGGSSSRKSLVGLHKRINWQFMFCEKNELIRERSPTMHCRLFDPPYMINPEDDRSETIVHLPEMTPRLDSGCWMTRNECPGGKR